MRDDRAERPATEKHVVTHALPQPVGHRDPAHHTRLHHDPAHLRM
jgi:hypothetical protein